MPDDQDIKTTIGADASPMKKEMSGVAKDVDILANSITAKLDRIGGAVEGVKSMVGTAWGGIQKAMDVTSAAARVEDLTAAYAALTGNAQLAAAMVKEISDFAMTTRYDPADVLAAGEMLLKSGIAAYRVGDIIKDLSVIARGDADQLKDLTKEVAKAYTSTEGYKTDFISPFAEKGINLTGAIGKVLGKQGEELKAAIDKGLNLTQVAQALRELAADDGALGQANDAANSTINGKIAQLKNSIGAAMEEFGAGINATLGPVIDAISTQIKNFLPDVKDIGAFVGAALGEIINLVQTIVGGIKSIVAGYNALPGPVKIVLKSIAAGWLAVQVAGSSAMKKITESCIAMCISMRTNFSAAITSMKAALISSGIGAAVVALGAGIAMAYDQSTPASAQDSPEQVEAQKVREREQQLIDQVLAEVKNIKGMDDYEALADKIRAEDDQARQEYQAAGSEKVAAAWGAYGLNLEKLANLLEDQYRGSAEALQAEKDLRKRSAEIKAATLEIEKRYAANMQEYAKQREAWEQKQSDRSYATKDHNQRQDLLDAKLKEIGILYESNPIEAITAYMDKIGKNPHGEQDKKLLAELSAIRDRYQELADMRVSMMDGYDKHAKNLEILRADLSGDEKRKQLLMDQLAIEEKTAELRKQGYSAADARKMAAEQVGGERVRAMMDKEDERRANTPLLGQIMAQTGVNIGNGGVSLGMARQTFQESRRQTRELEKVNHQLSMWKPGDVVARLDA